MAVTGSGDERKVITSFGKFPHSAITILDSYVQGEASHGTGILISPNHILTAAHNTYHKDGYGKNDGTRFTISADVNTSKDKGPFFNLQDENVKETVNYLAGYDETQAEADDISLLTTTEAPIAAKDAIGIMAFVNPETAKGFNIKMAGYPFDNVSADIKENSGKEGRDLVLAPGDGTGEIVASFGNKIWYSRNVDGAEGMSGGPIWHSLAGDKIPLLIDQPRVLGVHAYGNSLVGNSGVLITTDIYDKIMTQIEADSGTSNADELPENAIIGSDESFFFLSPTSGNDYIHGSYRKERIIGNSGNDTLFGGGADDRLEGGDGIDQALFSDEFANYDYTITDPFNAAFEFRHTRGTQVDATDTTKDIEFGVFEFNNGELFYVPLQVDPEDGRKIKDGAIITPEKDILNTDNEKIGTITVESPAWMFDGDVRYTLNIGSEQGILYNFAYIIDTSSSMDITDDDSIERIEEAKTAYQTLTQSLINNGIAENSEFAVIPFSYTASLIAPLDASSTIIAIDKLSASGFTHFGDALTKAQEFFTSPSRNNSATNIAYFLSDGDASGASNSLQDVAEVRAFGIGGAKLNTLNIIDSDNAVLLSNPADLISEFNTSNVDKDNIERIDVKLGGTVIDTILPDDLEEDALGLQYKGTIDGLTVTRTAENNITFDVVFKDDTPTASLEYKITTGQEQVTQQTNDGEKEVNIFGVNQADFTGNSVKQSAKQEIIGNDLDNTIRVQNNENTIFGNGGNDRFILSGGVNLVDGGEGIDTVEINQTQAQAGGVSKSGNTVNIGTDNTLLNVEFIQFSDVRVAVDTLAVTPTISLANQGILIAESNTGSTTATFTVNLSSTTTEDVVIDFITRSDDAEVGTDFVENTGQLTIAAGETSGDITLEILDDNNVEGDETLFLDLSVVSGGTFADGAMTETAGVKILDDDSVISISIAGDDTTVIEGSSGAASMLTLNLNRFGGLLGSDTVKVEIIAAGDNPAQASDFVGGFSSQQVTFAPDEDRKTIDIAINPDQQIEGDETFGVRLTSVSGSALVPSEELIFTILDDDEQQQPVNQVSGTSGKDDIQGTSGNDYISTGSGKDTLNGGLGNDTLIGGTEDDTYIVDSLEDTIIENESEGFDIVEASIDYSIQNIAHVEHLILTGNALIGTGNSLDNYIDGNALDNLLIGGEGDDDILALDGNDTLDGGTGNDTLRGGKGDDTYIIDSISDTIIEESGNDTVKASINYSIASLRKINNLTLTGNAISGTGNSGYNVITGNDLDNILDGGEGNDTLNGGAGNDSLIGGTLRDILNGGQGDDTLEGGEGDDTLNGGAGNNTLIGGEEDDIYIIDSANDIIIENTSEGFDVVEASVDYSIDGFDNVEHLILTGNALVGTGNSLDNFVDGNALDNLLNGQEGDDDIWGLLGNDILNGGTGDDTLTGHEGNDTLAGGMGDDELIGGTGADIFVFDNPNEGIDKITDFSVIDDTIYVSAAGFGGGLTAGDTISEDQILIGSSSQANTATQRFIYKTNTGALYFDADGNQTGFDAVQIARISNEPTISADDIFVIS